MQYTKCCFIHEIFEVYLLNVILILKIIIFLILNYFCFFGNKNRV